MDPGTSLYDRVMNLIAGGEPEKAVDLLIGVDYELSGDQLDMTAKIAEMAFAELQARGLSDLRYSAQAQVLAQSLGLDMDAKPTQEHKIQPIGYNGPGFSPFAA